MSPAENRIAALAEAARDRDVEAFHGGEDAPEMSQLRQVLEKFDAPESFQDMIREELFISFADSVELQVFLKQLHNSTDFQSKREYLLKQIGAVVVKQIEAVAV